MWHLRAMVSRFSPRAKYLSVFDDRCGSFAAAQAQAIGFHNSHINANAVGAAKAVIEGRGAFERDGVLFDEPEPRVPVVSALANLRTGGGVLRVLDIGGGLGSSYWQNRDAAGVPDLDWTVVERDELVELAKSLPTHPVKYRSDLQSALKESWDAIVLSSVLQYLPDPKATLQMVTSSDCRAIIVDRTPMHAGAKDIACLQKTPAHIYPGSYAAWILSRSRLEDAFQGWKIIDRFPGIEPNMCSVKGVRFEWRGCVAERSEE